jgi:hypothetical protein
MGRAQTGLTLAGLTLTAAVLVNESVVASVGFVVLTFLVLVATIANRAPLLHRLPCVGAPRVSVDCSLEGRQPLSAGMRRGPVYPIPEELKATLGIDSEGGILEPRIVHLEIGLVNEGRSVLRDVSVTFMHPEGLGHEETDSYGIVADHGRWMPPTSESLMQDEDGSATYSDYWVWGGDLPARSTLLYFSLEIPRPGTWPIRVKVEAPDLYREVVVDDAIAVRELARGQEPASDLLSSAIQHAEALKRQLERTDVATDKSAVMSAVVRLTSDIPANRGELAKLIVDAPARYTGPEVGSGYEAALLGAKIRAAYDARRRFGSNAPN